MLNFNNEVWLQATRIHEVSNYGNVRNLKSKKHVKLQKTSTGYYEFFMRDLRGGRLRFKVHHLVAKLFVENANNKPYINHIDGNKLNNSYTNLEWCTHKENMEHASKIGLISKKPRTLGKKIGKKSKYHNVSWDSNRQKWSAGITVDKKCLERKRFSNEEEAGRYVNYLIDKYQLDRPKNIIK